MIAVIVNTEGYEYDIHSLVKAFYPQSDVKVFVEGEKEFTSDAGLPMIRIVRSRERILLLSACKGTEGEGAGVIRREAALEPESDKVRVKNILKQMLYQVLSEYTGRTLPWGTLTGIRPTRIAMTFLEQGQTPAEIISHPPRAPPRRRHGRPAIDSGRTPVFFSRASPRCRGLLGI